MWLSTGCERLSICVSECKNEFVVYKGEFGVRVGGLVVECIYLMAYLEYCAV